MPKLPRVSSIETIRTLEKLGFVQVRQRGSHIILKKQLSAEEAEKHRYGTKTLNYRNGNGN